MRGIASIAAALAIALLVAACSQQEAATEPAVAPAPNAAAEPSLDPVTGLKMSDNWEIVRAHCTGCHSARLITQQRGSAEQWLVMIRWMQKKQNLWQFEPDTENRIIAYLAANYPPSDAQRRAAIPPDLMPLNPYSLEN